VVLPPETFTGAIWINAAGITAAAALLAVDWLRAAGQDRRGSGDAVLSGVSSLPPDAERFLRRPVEIENNTASPPVTVCE
jgi:hypothetical protein